MFLFILSYKSCRYLHNAFINPLQLTQLVSKPTRITDKSETLIDLILVMAPHNVKVSNVADIPGISDHCFIYMAYAINRKKKTNHSSSHVEIFATFLKLISVKTWKMLHGATSMRHMKMRWTSR